MSTLGTQRLSKVEVSIPRWGAAFGSVVLEQGPAPAPGIYTLTIADLPLVVSVLPGRSGEDAPSKPHVAIANGVGWETAIRAKSYYSPLGVRLSTVLTDLARDCGKMTIDLPTDGSLGTRYVRAGSAPFHPRTGRDMLATLVALRTVRPWWVDIDGRTRFGGRVGAAVAASARIMSRDLALCTRTLAVDSAAAWLPGNSFEGAVIGRVVIRETPGSLAVQTWEEPS